MSTLSQRRRNRMRLLRGILGLFVVSCVVGGWWLMRVAVSPSHAPADVITTAPPVHAYVPPHVANPQQHRLVSTLSDTAEPGTMAYRYMDKTGAAPRRAILTTLSTTVQSATDEAASGFHYTSYRVIDGMRTAYPASQLASRTHLDPAWRRASFCHGTNSLEARRVCASSAWSAIQNGVILFMAPGRCDDTSLAITLDTYRRTVGVTRTGSPGIDFAVPPFPVSQSENRTLRFLFHILPALNQNVLFFHPSPVHIFCRGVPLGIYTDILQSVLPNAVFITVEDVTDVLAAAKFRGTATYAHSTFRGQILAALSARATTAAKQKDVLTLMTMGVCPARDDTETLPDASGGLPQDLMFPLERTVDLWLDMWEERRFWSYLAWWLPSLSRYDLFWRLDSTHSLFVKPQEEDIFARLIDHGCAFGFHKVAYSSRRFARGVMHVTESWLKMLEAGAKPGVSAETVAASLDFLTDGVTGVYQGKHFSQDFFLGAFSVFQLPLFDGFWRAVEGSADFNAFRMRWDDGIAQTVMVDVATREHGWHRCHFDSLPSYRYVE